MDTGPQYVVLDGPHGPLAFERWGSGPSLVLLAGLGSRPRLWGELPRLLSRRFTVAAPDNRGVGGSRGGRTFTLDRGADDAAAVVGALGGGPAAVIGVSMGALVACRLAAAHPGAVRRVVAASCASRLTPAHGRVLRFFELILTRMSPTEAAEALMTFAFAATFSDRYPGFVDEAVRLWTPEPADIGGTLEQLAHLRAGFDLAPSLAAAACPFLVLAGELDPIVPAAATAELAGAIPDARFEVVPGAAHSVLAEGGPALLEAVVAFLTA